MDLKKWLKEEYKRMICMIIYSIIMIYIGIFISIILMWIIGGVVIMCCVVLSLEYQIRKNIKRVDNKNG